MRAVRFRYRPIRYLVTRAAARKRLEWALGPGGCVTFDDVEPPALPGPDWVRVETTMSGVCGTDLSVILARDSFTLEPFGAYPFTFGHENVGRIVEVGDGVEGWAEGRRVIVNPMLGCAQRGLEPVCDACARGEYGICRHVAEKERLKGPQIGYSPTVGGGWSRYFVAHRTQLHAADDFSDEAAVFADPFASALRPVLLHPPRADDVVLVVGAGTIGLLTVAALRLSGWEGPVAVVGRYAFQRELAERLAADPVLSSDAEMHRWAAALPGAREEGEGVVGGPSLVYDTVGSTASIAHALVHLREGGRLVVVGSASQVEVDYAEVLRRQLEVTGVYAYGEVPFEGERRDIYAAAIELMRRGDFGSMGLLTHIFPLSEYRQGLLTAMDKGRHRSVKVAFRPDA